MLIGQQRTRVDATDTNVRTTAGVLDRIIIIVPGSAGSISIWDGDAAGDETAANLLFTRAFGGMVAGDVISLNCPVDDGIRVDITTGGIFQIIHGSYHTN